MPQCAGIKRDGGRCTATVEPPNTHCFWHDPANSEKRKRAASKGGKSKPNREIGGLKQEVKDLIADVKAGEQDRAVAAVALQGYRVLKDYIELERKLRELYELEERVERLEQEGGRGWGA